MKKLFADRVIAFNKSLKYLGELPQGYNVLNPYLNNAETMQVMQRFYYKYYNDNTKRKFIIGINPSRNGAGVTGIPFTDTKRLQTACNIDMHTARTHEISSVFMYDMIAQYGGVEMFYKQFYINSPFPLAIVKLSPQGAWVNANYYDQNSLFTTLKDFMIESLQKHISMGIDTDRVFVLGKKNAQYIAKLNHEAHLFDSIEVLEHPRFIQQYQSKDKMMYIDKYIKTLHG